jgi:hypothetical protein
MFGEPRWYEVGISIHDGAGEQGDGRIYLPQDPEFYTVAVAAIRATGDSRIANRLNLDPDRLRTELSHRPPGNGN